MNASHTTSIMWSCKVNLIWSPWHLAIPIRLYKSPCHIAIHMFVIRAFSRSETKLCSTILIHKSPWHLAIYMVLIRVSSR